MADNTQVADGEILMQTVNCRLVKGRLYFWHSFMSHMYHDMSCCIFLCCDRCSSISWFFLSPSTSFLRIYHLFRHNLYFLRCAKDLSKTRKKGNINQKWHRNKFTHQFITKEYWNKILIINRNSKLLPGQSVVLLQKIFSNFLSSYWKQASEGGAL